MTGKTILLVYDKQCPACDYYCNLVRIQETVGELRLVNARESTQVMDEITRMGLDIDQGMVVKVDDQVFYGSEAIHVLALLGTRSGFFNRCNYWVFRSKKVSMILYPVLKLVRNLLLRILGVSKLNNLSTPGNERF